MEQKNVGGRWVKVVRDVNGRDVVLTDIDTLDRSDGSYQFDELLVVQAEDGRLFYGTDSGCSCPTPFEDVGALADLTPIVNTKDSKTAFERAALSWVEGSEGCSKKEVLDLIDKVRALLKYKRVKVAG